MRKAIINEEFELYYQPLVEAGNGRIYGAEVLIRWNHKEWGLVSPGEFIPLAEENHLIHDIGDWVIRKACAQLREWKEKEYPLRPIAINISPIRFMKKGLVELVKEQLDLYQIPANYLEFEITEGSLLRNEKNVLTTLQALKDLGVQIAIDDFGTGFSSLDYLRTFKPNKIKIDQTFIRYINQENNKIDSGIVSSLLYLAKAIDTKIVAEGVEEFEQYEFLKQRDCDLIQGYLFSKPVKLERYEQLLKSGYIKPQKNKTQIKPEEERRAYYRLKFPYHLAGEMTIIEVNKRKLNLSSTPILIENISLGGMKILSALKLPINSNIKFKFKFRVSNEEFQIEGSLKWKNEGKANIFYYGVSFQLTIPDEDRLAPIINQLSTSHKRNQEITDTSFVYEQPQTYFDVDGK
ncbi:EAL domain-containing protein [Virgibacillus halodenitrificans]|uniref:EAL domain-containing protein n=1 Tax=Virgibacillus halodenitrificans TaxID=1482 RepID=UPI002DBD280C|nr:EAL domain-containing protein [Virgibacillus halodenitrificans]MEC2159735.1 EAL domain-containing protein [Virgibacillus halodenitrificans]